MFVKIGPCRYEEMMNPQHGYGMIKPSKKGHPQIGHKFRTQNCLKPQVVDGFRSSIMTLVGQSGPAPKSSVEAQIKRLTRPRVQITKILKPRNMMFSEEPAGYGLCSIYSKKTCQDSSTHPRLGMKICFGLRYVGSPSSDRLGP